MKSDKAQMRIEIDKVYELVSKLRKENEKLRTDMMMVQQQQQQTYAHLQVELFILSYFHLSSLDQPK